MLHYVPLIPVCPSFSAHIWARHSPAALSSIYRSMLAPASAAEVEKTIKYRSCVDSSLDPPAYWALILYYYK